MIDSRKDKPVIPADVLEAFGAEQTPVLLPGGKATYRSGHVVLKRTDDEAQSAWAASVFDSLKGDGFRVPKPLRSRTGAGIVDGWEAWEFLEGVEERGRWGEKIAVSRRFHRALEAIPDPGTLRDGTNPWSVADRVAWDEQVIDPDERVAAPLRQLRKVVRPLDLPCQVIHGDLGTGNILFSCGQPPAVIDFSPAWRPAGFALAIGVVDMMAWETADESILSHVSKDRDIDQLLVRALIRRLVEVDRHNQQNHSDAFSDVAVYQPVVDVICRRLR